MSMWSENDLNNVRRTGEGDAGWTLDQMMTMNEIFDQFIGDGDEDYVKHVSAVINDCWPESNDVTEWTENVRKRLGGLD